MNWHVFKRDDPDTWPELDCFFLVCCENDELVTCKWDNILGCFYNDEIGFAEFWECFYVSVGYLPYIEREVHPMKCMQENTLCEYDDNGYCLCETECQYKREATEYCLSYKRIWKEF